MQISRTEPGRDEDDGSAAAGLGLTLSNLSATLISGEFWPELMEEECKLPAPVLALMEEYGARFAAIKAPRYLEWQPLLGQVDLELEFADRTLQLQVSPLLATAIALFTDEKNTWTLAELAEEMELDEDMLAKHMHFWVNHNVLVASATPDGVEYTVQEELGDDVLTHSAGPRSPSAPSMLSAAGASSRQLEDAQTYIMALLNNGDLALGELHQRMQVFRSAEFSYTLSQTQLRTLCEQLVKQNLLQTEDGLFRKRRGAPSQ